MLHQPPFVPAGDGAPSVHVRTVIGGPKPCSTQPVVYHETTLPCTKRVAATKAAVIDAQLRDGSLEVNICALPRDDVDSFVRKLHDVAQDVFVLRLRSIPKKVQHAVYLKDELNDSVPKGKEPQPPAYLSEEHKHGVCISSAHMQHKQIRFRFYATLRGILTQSHITELELGMRLSKSGYMALSAGLKATTTLKRLSFAGNHMGDAPLTVLQDGLTVNASLEQLDLTACALTDEGMDTLASIIKAHASRRTEALFGAGLRQYPDSSLRPSRSEQMHHLAMEQMVKDVDKTCGGWVLLELALNPRISDKGAQMLRDALSFDRRLVMLSLRGAGLSFESEGEFVSLMKAHQALLRVDLRQCTGYRASYMGILKLHKARRAVPGLAPAKPAKPRQGCLSPTMTERSVGLRELLAERSFAPSTRHAPSVCTSPWASPRQPSMTRRSSLGTHLSWGDAQLLARCKSGLSSPQKSLLSSPTLADTATTPASPSSRSLYPQGQGAAGQGHHTLTPSRPPSPTDPGALRLEHQGDTCLACGATRHCSPMAAAHATVPLGVSVFQPHGFRTGGPRKKGKTSRSKRKRARLQRPGTAGSLHSREDAAMVHGSCPAEERAAEGVQQQTAYEVTSGELIAEVAAMLCHLELEVSKAEYQAQLTRQAKATQPRSAVATAGIKPSTTATARTEADTYDASQDDIAVALIDALAPSIQALGVSVPWRSPADARAGHNATTSALVTSPAAQQVAVVAPAVRDELKKLSAMCDAILQQHE